VMMRYARLVNIPVMNHANIQYSKELKRIAPTMRTAKLSRSSTRAGGSSLFGTRRRAGPGGAFCSLVRHACQFVLACELDNSGTRLRAQNMPPSTRASSNKYPAIHTCNQRQARCGVFMRYLFLADLLSAGLSKSCVM